MKFQKSPTRLSFIDDIKVYRDSGVVSKHMHATYSGPNAYCLTQSKFTSGVVKSTHYESKNMDLSSSSASS